MSKARAVKAAVLEGVRACRRSLAEGRRDPMPPLVDLADCDEHKQFINRFAMTGRASLRVDPDQVSPGLAHGHFWRPRYIYDLGAQEFDAHTGLFFLSDGVVAQSGPPLRDLQILAAVSGSRTKLQREKRAEVISGPVFPLGREPIMGYYHWTVDILPRLLHVKSHFPTVTAVGSKVKGFVREALEWAGVGIVETSSVVRADHLVLADHSSWTWSHPSDIDALRSFAGLSSGETADSSRSIYVTRKSSTRSLGNEVVLENFLRSLGFKVVDVADRLSFAEQVKIYQNASRIVAPRGAGLVNMVWAKKGCQVIEITAEPTDDTPVVERQRVKRFFYERPFAQLAKSAGHDFESVVLKSRRDGVFGLAEEAVEALTHRL